ncbi:MAG: response regulator [Candidatus Omnitrophica bacterium]|nr:response regulator [Candidatus Omnitrophota bacterium]
MPRQKILVVEDEFDVCSVLQSFFGKRGYDVSVTASGAEALRMIPALKPDIVLLDITLEEMNGLEVLEKLRACDDRVKIVIMTGQVLQDKTIRDVRAMGVIEYLQKPLVLSRLESIVVKALGGEVVPVADPALASPADAGPLSVRVHKIVDLLGTIRVQCENYVLDAEKGYYEEKPLESQRASSLEVMKNVVAKVDEIVQHFER